ncbi:hypothetical protein [Psychrobacter sp. I-STPA6b]|uniref:hypothetical protein n=1 Tax=Psychrobacter sp. I-STPA6b TaxID=2585718 RepID=UPI001D0C27B7|nr:hypothetical protein [Psychrobacter sp. I-STPA6b]
MKNKVNQAKERPIFLSTDEVKAILAGEKTQIRRRNNLIPSWDHYGTDIMDWGLSDIHKYRNCWQPNNTWTVEIQSAVDDTRAIFIRCPFGTEGDYLYVRETWRCYVETNAPHESRKLEVPFYVPDQNHAYNLEYKASCTKDGRWMSPVWMPKWASRLKLKVTGIDVVRVDRGVWDWVVDFEVVEGLK